MNARAIYRMSEMGAGRSMTLLMFETISASEDPGWPQRICHSGSEPRVCRGSSERLEYGGLAVLKRLKTPVGPASAIFAGRVLFEQPLRSS